MNRYILISTILLSSTAALAADPLAKAPADADSTAIFATHKEWEIAVQEKNGDDIVDLYTEDAVILPPGKAPVRGHDALKSFFADEFKDKGLVFKRQAAAVEKDGMLGYTIGTYRLIKTGEGGKSTEETGNYVLVWKKQADGSWKITTDIWSQGR